MRDILDVHFVLSLFHLAMVVPLFLFVGYQRSDTPQWVYLSLLSIGVVVTLYHGVRFVMRYGRSVYAWVNALHVLLVVRYSVILDGTGGTRPDGPMSYC